MALLAAGCGDDDATSDTARPTATTPSAADDAVPGDSGPADPVLEDTISPVGGTVKQLLIPGPETSVLVTCDQDGFEPFMFTDEGTWVGCQIPDGSEPGPASELAEATIGDTPSPVGGTVKLVTIPGPQLAVLVSCRAEGFQPFLFSDQGTWVGCES
jgi:hypothetical protein